MSTSSFQPNLFLRTRPVLGFSPKRRVDRTFAVHDGDGELIATIATGTMTSKFLATDALGRPICAGQAKGRGWSAIDADGTEIVTIQHVPFKSPVVLLRGGKLRAVLSGSAFKPKWTLTTMEGSVLLRSEFTVAGHVFPADDWLVRSDGEVSNAEVIAIVYLQRLKAVRAGRAGFVADIVCWSPLAWPRSSKSD